jgi:hypothetical protein
MLPKPNLKPPAKGPTTGYGGFKSSSVSYFFAPTILSGAERDPAAPAPNPNGAEAIGF